MVWILSALLASEFFGQTALPANLNFSQANLAGWEGQGFYLTPADARGPGLIMGACSSDAASPTKKGMVRHVFTVPSGPGFITFRALAAVGPGQTPDHRLDVVLTGAGEKVVPRQVRGPNGWTDAPQLLPRWQGLPREYRWDVSAHAGRLVQIVLVDQDDRPGCWVYAAAFRWQAARDTQLDAFAQHLLTLEQHHHLTPMARFDSKRFIALGNAGEKFMGQRLGQCEIFYDLFYHHFRGKGFKLQAAPPRMHLAVFDSPQGFEAYLKQKVSAGITGMYHPATNRLVLYDLSENRAFVAQRDQQLKIGKSIRSPLDKSRFVDTVQRRFDDFTKDVTLGTTMHEAAHLLSFNCGLLNRQGDAPASLVEGLACYCEATEDGDWQALGAPNPMRLETLRRALDGKNRLIPLEKLLRDDNWLQTAHMGVGYAQSWALFHQLMYERPKQLQAYLDLIYPRRGPDHRLTDFLQVFGADLAALERRHVAYVRELLAKHPPGPVR